MRLYDCVLRLYVCVVGGKVAKTCARCASLQRFPLQKCQTTDKREDKRPEASQVNIVYHPCRFHVHFSLSLCPFYRKLTNGTSWVMKKNSTLDCQLAHTMSICKPFEGTFNSLAKTFHFIDKFSNHTNDTFVIHQCPADEWWDMWRAGKVNSGCSH